MAQKRPAMIDKELYKKFRIECIKRDKKAKEALEEAIKLWLAKK